MRKQDFITIIILALVFWRTNATGQTQRNYHAFDFGPTNSPVYEEFVPVDEKTVYRKEKGYGWIPFKDGKPLMESDYGKGSVAVPGLMQRDRGKGIKTCDTFFRDFCGAQRAYNAQVEQEFAVDVKNGQYIVYLTSCDIAYGKIGESKMTVDAENKRVINSITCGFDLCARVQFETEVTDGQLNLHFGSGEEGDSASWNVNGILFFPANSDIEKVAAQRTIKEFENNIVEKKNAAMLATFKKVAYEEQNQLFPLTKTDIEQGCLLLVRDWMKMVYPNTIPAKEEVDNKMLSLWCSPGEYEPATFGIYPLTNLQAEIETSDFISDAKAVIVKENVSVRVTGYIPERMSGETRTAGNYTYYLSGSSWSTKYMEKVPKVLWPYKGTVELNAGETKQIWLTFHVPGEAKPGIYEGTIIFRPKNFPQQTLKAKLTVYPVKLTLSDRFEGMYWYEALKFYPQHRKKELLDMAQHGIRAIVLGVTAPELKENNGNVTLDFTKMDALVQEVRDAGLTASFMPFETSGIASKIRGFLKKNASFKVTFDDLYTQAIGEIYKHAKEKDWPKVLFYPVDEIGNSPDRMDELKKLGALIKKTPGAVIYCTANNFESGKKCEDFIDYWCANIPMTKEQEQYVLSKGKTYMRYGNAYNFNPRVSRTVSGFGLWRTAAVAMYYWHYQACNGDPFNPLDGSARDWCASYPSPDGPVNSIDFESIREGIDDLNYIRTLQVSISEAKKKGKNDLIKEGEAILNEIRTIDPTFTQYDLINVPNEKYHEFRFRMAQEIMKLQEAVK